MKRKRSKGDTSSEDDAGLSETDAEKRMRRPWSSEEDNLLRKAVEVHNGQQWKNIAKLVPGRSHVQCLQRWNTSLHPSVVKGRWTSEEDQRLLDVVSKNPHLKNWGFAAKLIPGRTAKQCRERYTHHLDPRIKKGNWNKDEDRFIREAHRRLGNKWAEIATQLPGRTENSIKIRLQILTKREKRLGAKTSSSVSSTMSVSSAQSSSTAKKVQSERKPFVGRSASFDERCEAAAPSEPAGPTPSRSTKVAPDTAIASPDFAPASVPLSPRSAYHQQTLVDGQHHHHTSGYHGSNRFVKRERPPGNENYFIQVPGQARHSPENDAGHSPTDLVSAGFFPSHIPSPVGYSSGFFGETGDVSSYGAQVPHHPSVALLERTGQQMYSAVPGQHGYVKVDPNPLGMPQFQKPHSGW